MTLGFFTEPRVIRGPVQKMGSTVNLVRHLELRMPVSELIPKMAMDLVGENPDNEDIALLF
jgi:hypothetical protein